MAFLSFIDGTPEQLTVQALLDGAQEAAEILLEEPDEDGSRIWDDEDRNDAQADIDALAEILHEVGYNGVSNVDEVIYFLKALDGEVTAFIEEGQLEEQARARYEDSDWPSIIASNINWQGVVDDMTNGVYEITVNNGTYYAV
jgi:hypothetical protein